MTLTLAITRLAGIGLGGALVLFATYLMAVAHKDQSAHLAAQLRLARLRRDRGDF